MVEIITSDTYCGGNWSWDDQHPEAVNDFFFPHTDPRLDRQRKSGARIGCCTFRVPIVIVSLWARGLEESQTRFGFLFNGARKRMGRKEKKKKKKRRKT